MAVTEVKNIVATVGTYQKDGQEKKKYLTVGALFIYDDGGMSIKIDALPTNFDGNLSIYARENNNQQQNNQNSGQGGYQQQNNNQGGYTQNNQQQGAEVYPPQYNQAPQQQYNQQ